MIDRWLIAVLESPLMGFGDISIDQMGPTRNFPASSMLTGLMANALGWTWDSQEALQQLQDRLVFGSIIEQDTFGQEVLTDSQNVHLRKNDRGWTTWGIPARRDGATYDSPHRRFRDYLADTTVWTVIRLTESKVSPTIEEIASALDRPSRPLYIGRKSCIPSRRISQGWLEAENVHSALCGLPVTGEHLGMWPFSEGPQEGDGVHRVIDLTDTRDWVRGVHMGSRVVVEGFVRSRHQE